MTLARELYTYEATVVSANGNTPDLYVGDLAELTFDATISAIDAGNTLTLFVERKGTDLNYYPVYSPAAITATGMVTQSIGRGLQTAQSFAALCRIRWTVTSGKNATLTLSLIGK